MFWMKERERGGGKYQDFPSKNFSLTVPKNFVGQLCCAVFQKLCGSENFMNKVGGIKIFRRKFFLSQCRKISQGNLSLLL